MQRFLIALCIAWAMTAFAHEAIPVESSVYIQQDPLIPEKPTQPIPILEPPHKSAFLAVGLSALPGLGHYYLGDYKTASEFFLAPLSAIILESVEDLRENRDFRQCMKAALSNTWNYGFYAAYRDVRIFNNEMGYRYKMPRDSLADLSSAPFRWKVIEKPEVWGGLLGFLAAGTTVGYFAFKDSEKSVAVCSNKGFKKKNPLIAFPVGIGEEAFFRGYLQSCLSEVFTVPGGIALSSLLFAAAHIPNADELKTEREKVRYYTYILPYIATCGVYEGWLTYKNQSLQESVAIHAWYDFILLSLSYTAAPTAITPARFATSFTF